MNYKTSQDTYGSRSDNTVLSWNPRSFHQTPIIELEKNAIDSSLVESIKILPDSVELKTAPRLNF